MSLPIPKRLLIHTATHNYEPTKDMWGKPTFAKSQTLGRVRIEPYEKRKLSKDNTEIQLNSLLFFDCVNSVATDPIFTQGDQVTFAGVDYVVESITPIYDELKLHHYEVGLV